MPLTGREVSHQETNRPDCFPRPVLSGQKSPCGSDTWPSPNLMDCRKIWCHTKPPLDFTDPCLLSSALWTLGTILNGFRRVSGMTSPTCGTRVKADLRCYCALQHRFRTSEVPSVFPAPKPFHSTNQLHRQSRLNNPMLRTRVGNVCFPRRDMLMFLLFTYMYKKSKL